MLHNHAAYIVRGLPPEYPSDFNPSDHYPEYRFLPVSTRNTVYHAVRELLLAMGLDVSAYNTPQWNPLGELIQPGMTVVIKPNFVTDFNPAEAGLRCLITHGSILRALVDYCFIALEGSGRIVVCDAPLQSADYSTIARDARLDELQTFYRNHGRFEIEHFDLRKIRCTRATPTLKLEQNGDPSGYTVIDLGADSCHAGRSVDYGRYRVTDYDPDLMHRCHNHQKHEYLISNTVLSADVIINVPKLKTHRKAALTCAMKNMIGINCLKDFLPHHTAGAIDEGGDEYLHRSRLKRLSVLLEEAIHRKRVTARSVLGTVSVLRSAIYRILQLTARDMFFEGSWHGNDTMWRTVLDLNRILSYADKAGLMHDDPQRRCVSVVDAVIAGEGEGPLEPTSKACGALIAGWNPVVVDFVAAGLMGFDYRAIPQLAEAVNLNRYQLMQGRLDGISIVENGAVLSHRGLVSNHFAFRPPSGWKGHIELGQADGCRDEPAARVSRGTIQGKSSYSKETGKWSPPD